MTQPAKGQEPSMEEILASIRRIIADDQPANETTASRQEYVATARESAAPAPAPARCTLPTRADEPAAAHCSCGRGCVHAADDGGGDRLHAGPSAGHTAPTGRRVGADRGGG